jgi:hypothetical protein
VLETCSKLGGRFGVFCVIWMIFGDLWMFGDFWLFFGFLVIFGFSEEF